MSPLSSKCSWMMDNPPKKSGSFLAGNERTCARNSLETPCHWVSTTSSATNRWIVPNFTLRNVTTSFRMIFNRSLKSFVTRIALRMRAWAESSSRWRRHTSSARLSSVISIIIPERVSPSRVAFKSMFLSFPVFVTNTVSKFLTPPVLFKFSMRRSLSLGFLYLARAPPAINSSAVSNSSMFNTASFM